ncbi:MAG TPA: MauE/DoxX family redox-associated membrane protein [Candidatus Baltobacteraceae bacterium]|nr:MauE/DoxX family redox-associated membrane protein [Candidatus Baltobacteraceae bacterium]
MAFVVLALRVLIGTLLLVAGILKAHDGPAATASAIAAYRILPGVLNAPLGVFLPYFEIFLGTYLILGLLTRVVAAVASAQFVLFAAAVASLVVRHIPADCGCFGSSVSTPPSWSHVAFDVGLALLCALVAWHAPGAAALDRRFGLSSFAPLRDEG